MNIEQIDKWLKDQYGISYTELGNEFNDAVELSNKCAKKIMQKDKEIERLNNIINELEKYIVIEMNSFGICNASDIYYKLQQLKGEDKE